MPEVAPVTRHVFPVSETLASGMRSSYERSRIAPQRVAEQRDYFARSTGTEIAVTPLADVIPFDSRDDLIERRLP
jgi:hypothetical protein